MSQEPTPVIPANSADRPIVSPSQDLLGRDPFAKSLAATIAGWKGKDSLVIGLNGEWGSGKTSVKNLVLSELGGITPKVYLVEFNPWQWSGQKQIAIALFDELTKDPDLTRALRLHLSIYAESLKLTGTLLRGIRDFLLWLCVVAGGLAGFVALLIPPQAKLAWGICLGILIAVGGLLSFGENVIARAKGLLKAVDSARRKTLAQAKEDVSKSLQTLDKPLLIVLDDIDRLSPEEIKLVFQLVKANCDFPNVVYLLLFEKRIVSRALEKAKYINGADFIEKIVQVPFDIPQVERERIHRVLIDKLNAIFDGPDIDKLVELGHFEGVYHAGIKTYFSTLRRVYRFIGSLQFHVGIHKTRGAFEVNPVDLFALEALRVFEPRIYDSIRSNRSLFLQEHRYFDKPTQQKEDKEAITEILKGVENTSQEEMSDILSRLFPMCEWALKKHGPHRQIDDRWLIQRRVCAPDVFDRYFVMALPKGDISHSEVLQALSLVGNRDHFFGFMRALNDRKMLEVFLDRLDAYKETVSLEAAAPFITALCDALDLIPYKEHHMDDVFKGTPEGHGYRIVHFYLLREPDESKRLKVLEMALSETIGLYLPCKIVSYNMKRAEDDRRADQFIISEENNKRLATVLVKRIKAQAQSGDLGNQSYLGYVLMEWGNWGDKKEIKVWANEFIKTKNGLLKFANQFVGTVFTSGQYGTVGKPRFHTTLKYIELYVDIEVLKAEIEKMDRTGLDQRDLKSVTTIEGAIADWIAGGDKEKMFETE